MEMDGKAPAESSTIQHLELPAHAKASQNDIPVCKGFAFITFSEVQHAQSFLAAWPWAGSHKLGVSKGANEDEEDDDVGEQLMNLDLTKEKDEHEEAVIEGRESGLRSISLYVHLPLTYATNVTLVQKWLGRTEKGISGVASRPLRHDETVRIDSLKRECAAHDFG